MSQQPPGRLPASAILADLAAGWQGERIRLRDIVDALGDRAYGLLFLILTLPNVIPNLPGSSAILGVPLILVSAQLLVGRPHPWFPRFLAERSLAADDFRRMTARIVPWLERIERMLRPRLRWLSRPVQERFLAGYCVILAVVITLPIPLGNGLPALGIALIALGLVEHDGLAIAIGILLGLVGLGLASGVILGALHATFLVL